MFRAPIRLLKFFITTHHDWLTKRVKLQYVVFFLLLREINIVIRTNVSEGYEEFYRKCARTKVLKLHSLSTVVRRVSNRKSENVNKTRICCTVPWSVVVCTFCVSCFREMYETCSWLPSTDISHNLVVPLTGRYI